MLNIEVTEATNHQLAVAIYEAVMRMETHMAELSTAVTDLQASVLALRVRVEGVQGQVEPLNAALAAAQQALTDFQAADDTEDAAFQQAITDLQTQLAEALAGANTAADAIESSVADIDTVAAAPVEPPPAEEPPA